MRRLLVALTVAAAVLAPAATTAESGPSSVARMRADVDRLAGSPREAGTAAERAAADLVAQRLRDLGLSPSLTDVPLANGRTSRNVEVSIGGGPVEILLGAHLDTFRTSPGADDNASGVAILLEYARLLDTGAAAPPPGTTVSLVWFGAEEVLAGYDRDVHHAGSRQLAAQRAAAGALPHWMLSVDMVGYGPVPLAVHLAGADPSAGRVLAAAARFAGAPATESGRGDIGDHEPFARRGTPSAMLWRPDNPAYHGPRDSVVLDDRLAAGLDTARAFVSVAASPFATGRGMAHELVVDLLARRPDLGGAAHFGGRLDRGEAGAGDVGADLLASPEWTGVVAPVARVYLAAFGRQADHGGLVHWTATIRRGATLEAVAAAFVAAPEFAARYGAPDDRGFVRLLYRNVLGRDPDAAGEQHWVDQLGSGRLTRPGAVVAFAGSAEHLARTASTLPVALAYEGLLRRPVDASGLAYWRGRPVAELVGGLVGSSEFRARVG